MSKQQRRFRQFSHHEFWRCIFQLVLLSVLSDTLVLRCMMFRVCFKEADWGMMACCSTFAPWLSENHTMSFRLYSVTQKQHPCPSNTRHWFRQFLVISHCLDKGMGYAAGATLAKPVCTVSQHKDCWK